MIPLNSRSRQERKWVKSCNHGAEGVARRRVDLYADLNGAKSTSLRPIMYTNSGANRMDMVNNYSIKTNAKIFLDAVKITIGNSI